MNKKRSEYIEEFLNFLDSASSEYNFALDEMKREEAITQDLLHKLELENLSYYERCKLATRLKDNRMSRRKHKDAIEELDPIVEFKGKNISTLNSLRQTLGAVRKKEAYHNNRHYVPKVLKEE